MSPKQTILLFSVMLIFVLSALFIRFADKGEAVSRIDAFPREGTGFSSREIELSDFERDMLGAATAYKAVYSWKGGLYAVTIIDGSKNRQAVHDPRYCFRGAGWAIVSYNKTPIKGGHAEHLWLEKSGVKSEALFFYSDGNSAFASSLRYWMTATWRRWMFFRDINEPILVMIQPVDQNTNLNSVLSGLLPILPLP